MSEVLPKSGSSNSVMSWRVELQPVSPDQCVRGRLNCSEGRMDTARFGIRLMGSAFFRLLGHKHSRTSASRRMPLIEIWLELRTDALPSHRHRGMMLTHQVHMTRRDLASAPRDLCTVLASSHKKQETVTCCHIPISQLDFPASEKP